MKKASRRRIKARAKLGQAIARQDIERHALWAWTKWFLARRDGLKTQTYEMSDALTVEWGAKEVADNEAEYEKLRRKISKGQP